MPAVNRSDSKLLSTESLVQTSITADANSVDNLTMEAVMPGKQPLISAPTGAWN